MKPVPIFRPSITEQEIDRVAETLRSRWLGSGPMVAQFEEAFAKACGVRHAVSTSSGTTALSTLFHGLGLGPGDEVILPSFTYVSLLQCVLACGAVPVFCDIEPARLTVDPLDVASKVTDRTKGILAVHHGGQLADLATLRDIAESEGLWLVDDAAHAAGASDGGRPVGSLADATVWSFSAVKNLTTGSGGMVTTNDTELAERCARFRSLGLSEDTWQRYGSESEVKVERWAYDVDGPGQNFAMNDVAASLGIVQLERLSELNLRRRERVAIYQDELRDIAGLDWVVARPGTQPSWHMFTVRMNDRDDFIDAMQARGVSIGVHYHPIHLLPMATPYATKLPATEWEWKRVTTFPLFPDMADDEQARVIDATRAVFAKR